MNDLHCPDCGKQTLRLIEDTEPDGVGEYKEVRTCDDCESIVYIVRRQEQMEPGENDLTTEDHIHFYLYGKLVLTIEDGHDMKQELLVWMDRESYYPSVYWISDHGNAHLINLDG